VTVSNFLPSTHGFHFGNAFSGPDLTVSLPAIGTVDIGDASTGVCGGMVFAVRDFFEAKLPMLANSVPPQAGTPLFTYITGRLFDSGHPCPLGLVTVYSANPADLGHNHVVLAYGYSLDDASNLTISVGDPNSPDNDGVQMSLNIANPGHTTPISHNINIGFPVRGFFALTYSPHDPVVTFE
jgi:hypothetical protein